MFLKVINLFKLNYLLVFRHQFIMGFRVFFVNQDAINRTNLLTLRLIVVSDALRTEAGVDFVNFLTLRDCIIRAFRFAHVAVNALICNKERHFFSFSTKLSKPFGRGL